MKIFNLIVLIFLLLWQQIFAIGTIKDSAQMYRDPFKKHLRDPKITPVYAKIEIKRNFQIITAGMINTKEGQIDYRTVQPITRQVHIDSVFGGNLLGRKIWDIDFDRDYPCQVLYDPGTYLIVANRKAITDSDFVTYGYYLIPDNNCIILPDTPENRIISQKEYKKKVLVFNDKEINDSIKPYERKWSPFPPFAFVKLEVKKRLRWSGNVIVDSVLIGDKNINGEWELESSAPCELTEPGKYIALTYVISKIQWLGTNPTECMILQDNPENREKLSKKYFACEKWRQIENQKSTKPHVDELCNE